MITGQNTEVRHEERTFHVQTEDKGRSNPFVESLIYLGGQVLASARTSYAEMLADGHGTVEIAALMDRQHRTMIAAIQRGRFDEEVAALQARRHASEVGPSEVAPPPPSPVAQTDLSLDDLVLDYLQLREKGETLVLSMQDVSLAPGTESELILRAVSSHDEVPIAKAGIDVKLICATEGPQSLGSGVTDAAGAARIQIRIPDTIQGAAALIVTASSAIGKAELKVLLA